MGMFIPAFYSRIKDKRIGMENPDKKKMMIIEAATKRFAHFGMTKTTMNEIAQDLSFSKALLYYYFPDKNSLYKEVFLHIIQKMSTIIQIGLRKFDKVEDAMIYFLNQRQSFIKQYYNLLNYPQSNVSGIPKTLREAYDIAEGIEVDTIKNILMQASENGELDLEDCEEMANMVLYAMIGMRLSVFSKTTKPLFPSMQQFEEILNRQKKIVLILLKGIKADCLS